LIAVKILIQNPAAGLPPQYIVDYLTPTSSSGGTLLTQDPQLLGNGTSINGVSGTYTGTISLSDLTLNISLSNVVLNTPFAGGSCIITINGVTYFSP
jgi:hypothetical protein